MQMSLSLAGGAKEASTPSSVAVTDAERIAALERRLTDARAGTVLRVCESVSMRW